MRPNSYQQKKSEAEQHVTMKQLGVPKALVEGLEG